MFGPVAFASQRLGPLLSVSVVALMAALTPAEAQQAGSITQPGWSTVTRATGWTTVAQSAADAAQDAHPSGAAHEPSSGAAKEGSPAAAVKADAAKEGEGSEKPTVDTTRAVAPSATVNLINVLVEQGVITREQADNLAPQVDDEAMVTREAVKTATTKADEAAKAAIAAASAATPKGSKRVSYVPDIVKQELRDEIRGEVMSQAKRENWASPGKYPEWASRIKFYGDMRARYEGIFYPGAGYNPTGPDDLSPDFMDYNAINTGSPYDISEGNLLFPPIFNSSQDRGRFRMRARLGMEADLSDGFSAGMRIATGSDSSPVSTNQTLGGSGGNFSKYSLWLDRAWIKYDLDASPFDNYGIHSHTTIKVGRFDNPFWKPTDLVWDNDLGFDGVALQSTHALRENLNAFAVAGAFPIFNTALDFGSTERVKYESEDKYLYGAQVGAIWQMRPTIAMTFGASIFDYQNVKGKLSDPCDMTFQTSCSTDSTRPSFAQRGNSYRTIRNIATPLGWTPGDDPFAEPQYWGLVSGYTPIVLAGRVDFTHFNPVHVMFDGEFVWNAAFNKSNMETWAENNRGPLPEGAPATSNGSFDGGSIGWLGKVTAGYTEFNTFGDWNAFVGYKYLESDATLDAFADSDFGLGGTNLKGYFLGGNYALSKGVTTTVTWMSASSISGAPHAVDLLQLDLNAKF